MAQIYPDTEIKQNLFKHSAAIQIENNLTLLQRKTWNVLLWNAYDELPIAEMHSIPLQELSSHVGYDSNDQSYLKEATKAMIRCIVEWDILDKDGSPDWGATALLAQVRIQGGLCTYAYSPELRKLLYNPSMYARLDLDIQKQFDSKYALALWELCTDYLGGKRVYGETPWAPLQQFRKLMGLDNGQYLDFRDLTKRVINCALTEINSVSDFRVTVEYQRQGRKVLALKFKIRRVAFLPAPAHPKQGHMFPDLEDMPPVVKELRDAGLSTQDALEVWQLGFAFVEEAARPQDAGQDTEEAFAQYVREKIHLLTRRQSVGKIDNATGFLREALRKNYANPEFAAAETARAVVAQRQTQAERTARRAHLTHQLEDVQRAWDTALGTALSTLADTRPQVVAEAVTATLTATPFLRAMCPADGSPLDQYRASYALRSAVNRLLLPYAPEQVQALEAQYAPHIAALKAQMEGL